MEKAKYNGIDTNNDEKLNDYKLVFRTDDGKKIEFGHQELNNFLINGSGRDILKDNNKKIEK